NRKVDARTGYCTRSLLSLPLYNREKTVLGVIQVLNKKTGFFTTEDETFLLTFGNQAAVFLEMAQLQQAKFEALEQSRHELNRLNQVKDKALDHLSHELRTPLSVIQGNLRVLKRKLDQQAGNSIGESFFVTFEKHLNRLLEIQRQTDKIIRSYQALEETSSLKEAEQLFEKLVRNYKMPIEIQGHWQPLNQWLKEQNPAQSFTREEIPLLPFIEELLGNTRRRISHRAVDIELEGPAGLVIQTAPNILKDVLVSLIKNALENTPDEGTIRIRTEKRDHEILLSIEDFGTGITEENQKSLFDGLFHTQETDLYTSKKPYDFNAGGKGLELLQAKLFGQRFGFNILMESRRCLNILRNSDLCPGKISACPYCRRPEDCQASGGSIFSLIFPIEEG
ncbi:MAG: hypothetical protein C0407_16965, partial [Desulfobacca sp.]|nr:hypothetical protein [Desulfobacca sp.]